jgi:hypothetical protein
MHTRLNAMWASYTTPWDTTLQEFHGARRCRSADRAHRRNTWRLSTSERLPEEPLADRIPFAPRRYPNFSKAVPLPGAPGPVARCAQPGHETLGGGRAFWASGADLWPARLAQGIARHVPHVWGLPSAIHGAMIVSCRPCTSSGAGCRLCGRLPSAEARRLPVRAGCLLRRHSNSP